VLVSLKARIELVDFPTIRVGAAFRETFGKPLLEPLADRGSMV
jgi:hypothetical protein